MDTKRIKIQNIQEGQKNKGIFDPNIKKKKKRRHDWRERETLLGGANMEPKIPVEDEESLEPNNSEVNEEEDDDPTCFFPSISLSLSLKPHLALLLSKITHASQKLSKHMHSNSTVKKKKENGINKKDFSKTETEENRTNTARQQQGKRDWRTDTLKSSFCCREKRKYRSPIYKAK